VRSVPALVARLLRIPPKPMWTWPLSWVWYVRPPLLPWRVVNRGDHLSGFSRPRCNWLGLRLCVLGACRGSSPPPPSSSLLVSSISGMSTVRNSI